jgi:hypothetical protein
MDFLNNFTGKNTASSGNTVARPGDNDSLQGASSGGGGFMGKLNELAGGGKSSEANEGALLDHSPLLR